MMKEKINIIEDLKDIKEVSLKNEFWVTIKKWVYQCKYDRENFREEFLSEDKDKYFDELKDSGWCVFRIFRKRKINLNRLER